MNAFLDAPAADSDGFSKLSDIENDMDEELPFS